MSDIKLNMKLVAQGYDRKNDAGEQKSDGKINNDLRVTVPGVASVSELADALEKDQVVITGDGQVVAGRLDPVPGALADIQALRGLRDNVKSALEIGTSEGPQGRHTGTDANGNAQYEYRTTRQIKQKDGTFKTVYVYKWQEAVRVMLDDLKDLRSQVRHQTDARSRAIYMTLDAKIREIESDDFWDNIGGDESSTEKTNEAKMRYSGIYSTFQSIDSQLGYIPAQPTETMRTLTDAVGRAQKPLEDLKARLAKEGAGTLESIEQMAKHKIVQEKEAAAAVPLWQKILIFGLFKSWGHNKAANRIEAELKTFQALDLGAKEAKLADVARRAYETHIQATKVRDVEGATNLETSAKLVRQDAEKLKGESDAEFRAVDHLLEAIRT